MPMQWDVKCWHCAVYNVLYNPDTHLTALISLTVTVHIYFGNAETCKRMTWAFVMKSSYCLSEHCCIDVFRMSCARVRFSGTMARLAHACTQSSLCIPLSLSVKHAHTQYSTYSTHLSFLTLFLKAFRHLSVLHCSRHPFKKKGGFPEN